MGVWQSARDGKSREALTSMTMLLHAVQGIPVTGAMTGALCVCVAVVLFTRVSESDAMMHPGHTVR